MKPIFFLRLLPLLVALAAFGLARAASVPSFELPRWRNQDRVKLEDFAGQIVVLDFFAYWCGPCQRASAELEESVQKHYAARRGNPRGLTVRVLSINVEKDNPARTDLFIKKSGASLVLDDSPGELLRRFGGNGLPLIVVLDGSKSKPAAPLFDLVHRQEGLDNVTRLRKIIDSIGRSPEGAFVEPSAPPWPTPAVVGTSILAASLDAAPLLAALQPPTPANNNNAPATEPAAIDSSVATSPASTAQHTVEADFEALFASDILLTSESLAYGQQRGGTDVKLSLAHHSIDFDYQPVSFDFLGSAQPVDEEMNAVQLGLRQKVAPRWTVLLGGGLYEGYTDYRSAWLNEYYRQQFSSLPGYASANPRGASVSFGARWEYLPGAGFLQAGASYLQNTIAPGYEIDFDGLRRGRPNLYTSSYSVTAENILTRRIRVLNEFRLTDTTDRESRYGYQGSVNLALGERWVLRAFGGYTSERPRFEAWFVGGSLDYELTPSLILGLSGRYYRDTGEIENSLFSNAAPGLDSHSAGLGLRCLWGNSSLKLYAAPYFTRYEPFGIGTRFFQGLYRDRDWGVAQFAYSITF